MSKAPRFVGSAALISVVLLGVVSGVEAQSPTGQPTVAIDRPAAAVGDDVTLTIDGFVPGIVTVSVCGNEARRGSVDCNMSASSAVEVRSDNQPKTVRFAISAPPAGCPCVIRVSSEMNDEIVATPFTVIGQPIEPLVSGPSLDQPLVAVSIKARAVPHGLVRWTISNLGGSVPYQVTVTVKNLTTETINNLSVFGSLGRNADDVLATLALNAPARLEPGQTWKQIVTAKVPAPSINRIEWRAVASRAGPRVTATVVTRHRPVALLFVASLLVIDVAFLIIRRLMRRRAARVPSRAAVGPGRRQLA